MMVWIEIIFCNLLVLLAIQDFQTRTISAWVVLCLLLVSAVKHFVYFKAFEWNNLITNLLFFLFQILGLWLYFSWKNGSNINLTKDYLGLGDILFFIPLCFLFTPLQLIIYFIISIILTLILALLYQYLVQSKSAFTIPLAGAMSITLLINQCCNYWGWLNNFEDTIFITFWIN